MLSALPQHRGGSLTRTYVDRYFYKWDLQMIINIVSSRGTQLAFNTRGSFLPLATSLPFTAWVPPCPSRVVGRGGSGP